MKHNEAIKRLKEILQRIKRLEQQSNDYTNNLETITQLMRVLH